MKLQLGDVEETALIPLAVRASETKRKNARINDYKEAEIIDRLNIDTKNFGKLITHECVVARTILFDSVLKNYISLYPDAVVLNIGCGLDDRFSRVDNGKIIWYNIDLPDSVDVRRKVFDEANREHILGCDILEREWTESIPKDRMVIVVAEGIFMYFSKEQVSSVLKILTDNFKDGFLLAEVMRQKMMKEKMHDTVKHTNAVFGWGIDKSAMELRELCGKLSFVSETSFSEQMKEDGLKSRLMGTIIGNLNNRLSVFGWKN